MFMFKGKKGRTEKRSDELTPFDFFLDRALNYSKKIVTLVIHAFIVFLIGIIVYKLLTESSIKLSVLSGVFSSILKKYFP